MMNKFQTFQEFLATMSVKIPIFSFIINFILAAILSYIIRALYIKFGNSLSNREQFSNNFLLLSVSTMLIISIVKSSLALSLGLVGALSIVRFRAAIKEPEELTYLFLTIGIGLGLGADQAVITILALFLISVILYIRHKYSKDVGAHNQNLLLTVNSRQPQKVSFEQIIDTLKVNCSGVNLKRFDETKDILEASFVVEFTKIEQLNKTKGELRKLSDDLNISFLDSKGII